MRSVGAVAQEERRKGEKESNRTDGHNDGKSTRRKEDRRT